MELARTPDGYSLPGKVLSDLDRFVLEFVAVLDRLRLRYVIISGYTAILFGRSRSSEDVDMFLECIPKERFLELWSALHDAGFVCVNTDDSASAYDEYLKTGVAIRFSKGDDWIPNMEVKFPKEPREQWALDKRITVHLDNHVVFTSPIESQIPFKLVLGSDKDIEDARHLAQVFREHLDMALMEEVARNLHKSAELRRFLDDLS